MSRRVLLVCYYFPPLGLGGVGRPLSLFKRLGHHGWECDVLTVKPVLYRAYEPELLDGLDLRRIHRAGSYDPQRLLYLLGKRKIEGATISKSQPVVERFFPDSKVGWVGPAVRYGIKLAHKCDYDCIISTSPPISCHLVGMKLHKKLQIPWIADFRDFWTIYKPEEVFSDRDKLKRARGLLDDIKGWADAVTTVNKSIADYLRTGETITNGFDPDLARHWRRPPDNDLFTVGLLGHQHDTRVVAPLINLLTGLQRSCPETVGKIRLLQVGQIDEPWFRSVIDKSGLNVKLELRHRQKREETIRILSGAHLFYYGISEREGPGFVPGRTFELIASGRPIFAYLPQHGEVAWLLERVENSVCFTDGTKTDAVIALTDLWQEFEAGRYRFDPLSDYARQFSAEELARKFAQLMERIA